MLPEDRRWWFLRWSANTSSIFALRENLTRARRIMKKDSSFLPTKGIRSKEIKNSVFDFPSLTRGSRFRWRIAGGNEEEERMSRALDKLSSLKSWSANVSRPLLFVEQAISSPVSLILEMPAIYFVWTDSCVTVARFFHFLPLMLFESDPYKLKIYSFRASTTTSTFVIKMYLR